MFDSVFMSVWRSNSHYLEVYRAGLVFLVSSFVLVSLVVCIGDLVRFGYPGVCPL